MARAIVSVSDKRGLEALGRGLTDLGWEIVATGRTAAILAAAGARVVSAESVTGVAEMLDGRVKTLHPALHAGILARRDRPEDMASLAAAGIVPVDLVVVNLYPFRAAVAAGAPLAEAVEQIDVGGPTLIRAAAKNHAFVTVVVDPADYPPVLAALRGGGPDAERRLRLAAKAFAHTAAYDSLIATYLGTAVDPGAFPPTFVWAGHDGVALRYGENPHQRAAFYRDPLPEADGIAAAVQLGGKDLSYNNIMDADAAWRLAQAFAAPAAVAVKHATPCGVATAPTAAEAFARARAADPEAIFGGIVALNRAVDEATAARLVEPFLEVVVAPAFSPSALARLRTKKNLRLLAVGAASPPDASSAPWPRYELRKVGGGLLVQEPDVVDLDEARLRVVGARAPSDVEVSDLRFAWTVVRHVRSNAIVLARDGVTTGIGGGQVSRVGAVRQAVAQAGGRARGSVMASDAFFPLPDGIEEAARAGVTAVIQPGGSIRDADAIAAADAAGMAMLFTGVRHFRHG